MTKKIYRVMAEVDIVFCLDYEPDAEAVIAAIQDGAQFENFIVEKVTSLDKVPQKWHDSCPYGDDESALTVAERFAAMRTPDDTAEPDLALDGPVHWKNGQMHFTGTLAGFTGQGWPIVDDVHLLGNDKQWHPTFSPQHPSMSQLQRGTGIAE